jgi:hypothetical protein
MYNIVVSSINTNSSQHSPFKRQLLLYSSNILIGGIHDRGNHKK